MDYHSRADDLARRSRNISSGNFSLIRCIETDGRDLEAIPAAGYGRRESEIGIVDDESRGSLKKIQRIACFRILIVSPVTVRVHVVGSYLVVEGVPNESCIQVEPPGGR